MDQFTHDSAPRIIRGYDYATHPEALKKIFSKTFLWMTLALAISGLTAYLVSGTQWALSLLQSPLIWVLLVAEVALVWILSAAINRMSLAVAAGMLFVYAALNGVTLSFIFLAYTASTIYKAFIITAGTFAVMTVVGLTSKIDFSKWHKVLFMALIGIVVASVINIFLKSNPLDWIISIVGVLLFTGLTAYDVHRIRQMAEGMADPSDSNAVGKVAVLGALTLYLDFINLFLYILRILGRLNRN